MDGERSLHYNVQIYHRGFQTKCSNVQVLDSEGNSKPRGRVFIRYLASTEGKGKNLAGWSAAWRKPKGSSRG